jgi:MFS family permease
LDAPNFKPNESADQVAQTLFGVGPDKLARNRAVRTSLLGAAETAVLVPLLFYLRFREIGALGWGTTVFLSVWFLLAAVGLYFGPRGEYHTPIPLLGNFMDRLGAFWLVACVFGPLLGWIITSGTFPITAGSWRWLFLVRVFLAAFLPIVTALPLTRYVRGRSAIIALPLLVCVTLLPVSTAMYVSQDLWEGPVLKQVQGPRPPIWYLKHTERTLSS